MSEVIFSQTKKQPWIATQLYMFHLPEGLNGTNTKAIVWNKQNKKFPTSVKLAYKKVSRSNNFIYFSKATNILYGVKLPITLPANTYVWAFNFYDDTDAALMMVDDNLKVKITSTDKQISSKWKLPEIFDMNIQNVASVNEYLQAKDLNYAFQQKITTLSISTKTNIVSQNITDTSIAIDVADSTKIPKGLKPFFQKECGMDANAHHCKFVISSVFLYQNNLWFPFLKSTTANSNKIPVSNHPDKSTIRNYSSINGEILTCTDGGLTGGNCATIVNSAKKYRLEINIEY